MVRVMLVDDRSEVLQILTEYFEELCPGAEIQCFTGSPEALACAREKVIDLALLRVELPELSGIDLGRYLNELNPLINLLFLSDSTEGGYEAMVMHASGYLLHPLEEAKLRREMNDLRHPNVLRHEKRVFVQTFGNFEIFVDGKPVNFKYSRTKEIVAILVNNCGAQTTNGEIIACLWEDDGDPEKKGSYLSNLRQDLQNTFTKLKLNGVILKQRGSLAIAKDSIECDLYDWLEKREKSRYHYLGDYMNQYSWPEYRHAELDEISYSFEE